MAWYSSYGGNADFYIDLGTANTLVVSRRRGLVINEPSVIAYRQEGQDREIVAVGAEAKEKIGKTPGQLVADHPLKDGVIADLDVTQTMLKYFISQARERFLFSKPRVVISLPYGVTDIEKKAVKDAGFSAGAREVTLIDEPMAAALGSDLPIEEAKGNMIIDIGGGTTEVAVISLYGIVHCEAVRVGGHSFDQAIIEFIRRRHNLVVGSQSAERLKIQIGSALPEADDQSAEIRGVDFTTGLPKAVRITAREIHEALQSELHQIFEAGRRTLEQVPPELMPDLINDGAVVVGGGALLQGLEERLAAELKLPVRIGELPLLAIARGGEKALHIPGLLEKIAIL